MGKETDELLRLAGDVSKERNGREMDMLITAGERKAIALVAMAIESRGAPAVSFTGSQAGFLTDTNHMNAKILEVTAERIRETIAAGKVAVVAGAQGVSTDRDVTFLGRGGSDGRVGRVSFGGRLRALYRCLGRVHDGSAHREHGAQDPDDLVRRDVGNDGYRLSETGDALGRIRKQAPRAASRSFGLHVGTGYLDRGRKR